MGSKPQLCFKVENVWVFELQSIQKIDFDYTFSPMEEHVLDTNTGKQLS
jgi:hypothetical protein